MFQVDELPEPDEIPGDHPDPEEIVIVKAKIVKPSMQNVRVKS